MANGICDITNCQRKTYMGWRPLTTPLGRQICEYHWKRHCDKNNNFNLFDAFGFPKLPVENNGDFIRQWGTESKKRPQLCLCGAELLPRHRFCEKCAKERESRRKREYQRRRRAEKFQYHTDNRAIEEGFPRCVECGNERLPGHTYCEKCADRQKRKFNCERQCRHRKKNRFNVTFLTRKNADIVAKNKEKSSDLCVRGITDRVL